MFIADAVAPQTHSHLHVHVCVCVCAVKKNLKQRRKTERERANVIARERKSSEARVYRIVKFTNTKARLTDTVAA